VPPLHALAAGVMAGAGVPGLLLPAGSSPHHHALRPTEADLLHRAALVLWVGPGVEGFMPRVLEGLPPGVRHLRLDQAPGLTRRSARSGGLWAGGAPEHPAGAGRQDAPGHAGGDDPHVWLDPHNAAAWVGAIAGALAQADPANAALYRSNAAQLQQRLARLDDELRARLAPLAGIPYLVYHDAYQHLESRYGLTPAGAVSPDPDHPPGARRLAELRELVRAGGARCLFVEPQFPPDLAETLAEDLPLRIATLDPLGAALAPGPELYFGLLRGLAQGLADCLGQ
ncbi:MAG TPA: zinc ABC transporter substrate-binding protein, partial [Gammaproteobacteria bacterium]